MSHCGLFGQSSNFRFSTRPWPIPPIQSKHWSFVFWSLLYSLCISHNFKKKGILCKFTICQEQAQLFSCSSNKYINMITHVPTCQNMFKHVGTCSDCSNLLKHAQTCFNSWNKRKHPTLSRYHFYQSYSRYLWSGLTWHCLTRK